MERGEKELINASKKHLRQSLVGLGPLRWAYEIVQGIQSLGLRIYPMNNQTFDIDEMERALSRFEMDTVELMGEALDLPEKEEE